MAKMGFQFGLESREKCFKRKFRWLFSIPGVACNNALPPSKAARPNMAFKETQVEHISETVFIPSKPDWKPITLTLYDINKGDNPSFDWITECYDPRFGTWKAPGDGNFFREAMLTLYSGCGEPLESWKFENVWPQQIDFADLAMSDSELVTVDLTLRYARAYLISPQDV